MKLYVWRGDRPNFGDALNDWLWPALLPGFFDEQDAELVLGIGSVLDSRHDPTRFKIVLGAGYGGYERLPRIDHSWAIHWVRGPQTARQLGIDPALGLGDPAMLWPFAAATRNMPGDRPRSPVGGQVGFMPHFDSLDRGPWAEAAYAAGIHLIDPRSDPPQILAEIANCRLLISEAMHGAIVADTLRVPWIAVQPQAAIHRAKWQDWAGALGLRIRFQHLPPSSLYEWASVSRIASCRPVRKVMRHSAGALRRLGARRLMEGAAGALRRLVDGPGQLSELAALQRCQERMLARLEAARRDPRRPTALASWP